MGGLWTGRRSPGSIVALWFVAAILLGTFLLLLPFSRPPDRTLSLIDALFTSASAICVTGLVVKDMGTDFTLFGQIVILLLIQVGGLGYMTSATMITILLGKKLGLRDSLILQEAMNVQTLEGLARLLRTILLVTLVVEAIGAAGLAISFAPAMSWPRALYLGLFHSVAAFNNAGFSLFPDSLMGYRQNLGVNLIVIVLIVLGGLGVIVYHDLFRFWRRRTWRLSLHTRIVLVFTALLIVVPALLLWWFEQANPRGLGGGGAADRLMAAVFQAVSARTAGFNTVDIGAQTGTTLWLLMALMFIGGSPGGTAGGIKTTTFATMALAVWSTLRGREEITVAHRRLPRELVFRAFYLAILGVLVVGISTLLLLQLEPRVFLPILFEAVSAFGTVGLSTGDGGALSLSGAFGAAGKLCVILTMFAGRVGVLTLGTAMVQSAEQPRIHYPVERVLIG